MSIWFNKSLKLADIEMTGAGTMSEFLEMQFVELGDDYIKMKMPVGERTKQPYGLLHGGASCALAETAASLASQLVLDPKKFICVGIEINANHIQSARDGFVTAITRPLHLGATTHVWDIKIYDDLGKLVCVSRLTVAVIPRKESFRQPSL